MTENANLESKKLSHQVGSMAVKGMVGAISIAATAGIPLVIQKLLNPPSTPPAPVASPAATPSPAVQTIATPSPTTQTVQSAETLMPAEAVPAQPDEKPRGKERKGKKH